MILKVIPRKDTDQERAALAAITSFNYNGKSYPMRDGIVEVPDVAARVVYRHFEKRCIVIPDAAMAKGDFVNVGKEGQAVKAVEPVGPPVAVPEAKPHEAKPSKKK